MPWPLDYCPTCRDTHPGGVHLPEFRVGIPAMDDCDPRDYPVTHAHDAEHAAEKYAEHWDNGDYTLLNGSDATVVVLDEFGHMTRWRVTGETVAVYHAEEMKGA